MRLSCIVCFEIFSPSDNVSAAFCGHILHYHCWSTWLERNPHCPECREPVKKADLLKLFFTFDSEEGDYSALSSKYITLKYDFNLKNKEVQAANALVEEQKKEIKALQLQVEQWKTKANELQRVKSGAGAPKADLHNLAVPPTGSSFLSTIGSMPLLPYQPAWPYNNHYGFSLTNPWRSSQGETGSTVTFHHTVSNVSGLQDAQASESPIFWVQNFPWKIRIIPRTKPNPESSAPLQNDNENRWLGLFLQCTGDGVSTQWSCYAAADLKILPQKDEIPALQRKIHHVYHHNESDWGFRHFVLLSDLLNPDKGYIKDDSIVVEVRVEADIHGAVHSGQRSIFCSLSHSQNEYRKRLRHY